ncbi:MAG: hypothetical protein M5U01_09685 [Ardenticatenaceae bacterium]|nr:hypothetical protein [Ardenticatenaceae bacterium]
MSKQCGHFEYKVYDLRRVKDVYFYDDVYIAQGEFLLLFIEVKNISGGTSYFGQFGPQVVALSAPGAGSGAAVTGKSKASRYAQWMYQSGSFYEDINPGNVLGLVEAYDLPSDQEYFLAFGLESCAETTDTILSLGMWSQVPRGHKK